MNIVRNIIPKDAIQNVLRIIHLDLYKNGISAREIEWWNNSVCWFPHLRFDSGIIDLLNYLPEYLTTGNLCEPQIILSFPEIEGHGLGFHTDKEPDWALDKKYTRIIGVPLTPFTEDNGGIVFLENNEYITPRLFPGDIVIFDRHVLHSKGINNTGEIRYSVYFRWVEE